MKRDFFLFCGGPAIYDNNHPKPLMTIRPGESLIRVYLKFLLDRHPSKTERLTLLCDDEHKDLIRKDLESFDCKVPLGVVSCGSKSTTLTKLEFALSTVTDPSKFLEFTYPDIFFFGDCREPFSDELKTNPLVCISASPLTSRFPRLIIDEYKNIVRGISNYSSPVPANPHFVFGGNLWGQADGLRSLVRDFKLQADLPNPSLEFDFFFWLINQKKMKCALSHGERILVDSSRDVRLLLARLAESI